MSIDGNGRGEEVGGRSLWSEGWVVYRGPLVVSC